MKWMLPIQNEELVLEIIFILIILIIIILYYDFIICAPPGPAFTHNDLSAWII